MIAETALVEGVEVPCLMGTQDVGDKDMIEAIPDVVPITPTPPLLLRLPGIAMQTAIDIVQVVSAQLTQNTKLEFMLAGIFEDVVPVSLEVAPGDDLSVLSFVLWRIEIAAEQSGPICRGSECLVDPSQQIQLEVRIQLATSVGIRLVMIGRSDIDIRYLDLTPGTV
jgi:hypothetical protein